MKTTELTGAALDWAVSKAIQPGYEDWRTTEHVRQGFSPSTKWSQGGPIIEDEGISVCYDVELAQEEGSDYWATIYAVDSGEGRIYGPTPLIAAMRCYVASQLGDEMELPKGLRK